MSVRTESHIDTEAASWTTLLESGVMSQAQREAFHCWLGEPPHARALGKYRAMLGMIQDLPRHKTAALLEMPAPQAKFPFLTSLFSNPLRLSAVAAAAAAVVAAGVWQHFRSVREYVTQAYTTETGEARTVVLSDGTTAYLNTQSGIRWTGSGKERHVDLTRGEVLFKVAHDPSRPFRVTVGNSEIRDLATEFDVYRKANGSVVVTVLSGQVAIKELAVAGALPAWTERQLKPNEQLEYAQASVISDVHSTNGRKSVLWREGLLETKGLSLTAIVGELNRYSTKPILLADPRLNAADVGFGGALRVRDARNTLNLLQKVAPLVVTDTGDSYVLTYKADVSVPQENQNTTGHP